MSNQRIISLIVSFIALSKAIIISQNFNAKLEFNDNKSNNDFLGEYNSHSLAKCAAICQRECIFFGFNSKMKKCRTHKRKLTSEMSDEAGWRYYSDNFIPVDCKDLQSDGYINSGVYEIYPYGTMTSPVRVYCDMTTMEGGWTAIQKRVDGSVRFNRTWTEYKNGFGYPEQNVWGGNDIIHQLTKERNSSLYVSITLHNGTTLYEMYDTFSISDERAKYKLFLAGPATGTLGERMINPGSSKRKLSGMYFTTRDRDNDKYDINCATLSETRGGWWFNACTYTFLNAPWYPAKWKRPWYPAVTIDSRIVRTMMLVKRQ